MDDLKTEHLNEIDVLKAEHQKEIDELKIKISEQA